MTTYTGILTSQIGYDLERPMRAIVRGAADLLPERGATFTVLRAEGNESVLTGAVVPFGEKWGSNWWVADFSSLAESGTWRIRFDGGRMPLLSDSFGTGVNLLWERTWRLAALNQAERRKRIAEKEVGWYDAGCKWQELNSHAALLLGYADLLECASGKIAPPEMERILAQIQNGCEYLGLLQDRAAEIGHPGALVHQIFIYENLILLPDVAKAAAAFARIARVLPYSMSELRAECTYRAERAMTWLRTAQPHGEQGFSRIANGWPADLPVPDEWKTCDLLMRCSAAFDLADAGNSAYREECLTLSDQIVERQVTKEEAQQGLYGHFRLFASQPVPEKAWTHNASEGMGADLGETFPHYIMPLLSISRTWPQDPRAVRAGEAARNFAYGYFLPACHDNPFFLLPMGVFGQEGLLYFANLWHGCNAAYGLAATLAFEFDRSFHDRAFRDISTGCLQWIAGLNSGLTRESLSASHMYDVDVPEGVALPVSMMNGVGGRWAGTWMNIRGSIANGFCTGDQFKSDVEPLRVNDGPFTFTDEDWITHAGGWLSALARLR